MSASRDEFDIGPLSWVKPEIDLALRRADEGIKRFSISPGDQEIGRSTLAHLHQVSGALLMVGLEPVARVSESAEKLIELLGRGDLKVDSQATEAVRGVLTALGHYLEGLMRGDSNRPLILFPVYRQILAASGNANASEVDLFYPDLSRRPKFSDNATPRVVGAELSALLTLKRAEFQRGLLNVLRGKDVQRSLLGMRNAIATIEATQTPSTRMLWWIAVGFVEGLATLATPLEVSHKQLCGRIDLQIKRQAEGAETVSERLIRELLFAIAKMESNAGRVREIQETYCLRELLPPVASDNPEDSRVKHALRELREQLEQIKDTWLKFTSGNRASLNQFVEETAKLKVVSQGFGNEALQSVFASLGEVASSLNDNPREPGEALALETATALLMVKDAVENYYRLGPNFKTLAETAVSRIVAALKGQVLPAEGASQLADISRAAQEKILFFQLGQEILSNLNYIEQALDAFFRDPTKREDLGNLPASINQILGALSMLESEDAVNLLKAGRDLVQKFVSGDGPADPQDAELTAEAFSNLGLFVTALQQGRENANELLHPVLVRLNLKAPHPVASPEPEPEFEKEVPAQVIEETLESQKRNIAQLFERWRRESGNAAHHAGLTEALSAMRQDVQLIGRNELADRLGRALGMVNDASNQSAAAMRDIFVSIVGAGFLPEPQPVKPVGIVEPAAAEIDAELLEVFLEEASEVLGGIAIHTDVIASNPSDREAHTVIRRGFHTLKGSGRMVGLNELGEVAWQVEQVMNKWLRDEKPASKGLLRLITDAHEAFSGWIDILKTGANPNVQAEAIFRLADQLKNDQEPDDEMPAPVVAALDIPESVVGDPEPASEELVPTIVETAPETDLELIPKVVIGDLILDTEFFEIFANEASTHTATLRHELAGLHTEPVKTVMYDFMRAAHTLTGICRTSGFSAIAELGFGLEKWLLDRLDHPAHFSQNDLLLTTEVVEALGNMVSNVLEHLAPMKQPMLVGRLDSRLHQVRAERREQESKFNVAPDIETLGLVMPEPVIEIEQPVALNEADLMQPSEVGLSEAELLQQLPEVELLMQSAAESIESSNLLEPSDNQAREFDEPALPEPNIIEAMQVPEPVSPTTSLVSTPFATTTAKTPQVSPVSRSAIDDSGSSVETGKERRVIVDDVDEQLLPVFLEEAFDLLPDVSDSLRTWRATPANKAPVTLLGRHLHTLKGSARMAGVMRLGELAHVLENRVVAMQAAAQPAETDFEALEEGFDRFTVALERLKSGERIELMLNPAAAPAPAAASDTPDEVAAQGPGLATTAKNPAAVAPALPTEEVDRRAVLRVRADLIDRFVNDSGEISIARSRIEGEMDAFRHGLTELIENVSKLRAQLREIEIQAELQIQSSSQHKQEIGDTFDPLEFDRFTRMQELTRFMAESVHDFVTLQQSLTRNLDEADAALAAQSRLNRDLQQDLMSVRMVPLGNLGDRFYRIVRQTAKEVGKKANLEFKGMRTELDRSVLEQIVAPFEHLLRNAISHGIESPEVRQASGKSPIGEITIDARQQANEIILTFSDDGAGINLDRVRQKAIEQGLLSENENPDENHLIEYIFMPGFSTASEITQVAGRGVGMDVVKNAIVTLGGRVEVETVPGRGTRFTITLPLTLAVTQALLIRANGTLFAVPSGMVEQVQEWKIAEITALREKKEIVWQQNRYPFFSLAHLLGEETKVGEPRRYHPVLLLRSATHRAAVEIDSIEGNREIVVKTIGPQLSRLMGVAGATVLGNGQVVLMLNPVMLAGRQEGPVLERAEVKKAEVVVKTPVIMVVDDSLTVRKITSRLLLREGFEVLTAKDGVDALQQLQEFIPDVMLLDIEMPRMDGFELTRNIRADARIAGIPIIMITSRTAEKHRNVAFELGVNAYLGKPFQEEELLGHINSFLERPVVVN